MNGTTHEQLIANYYQLIDPYDSNICPICAAINELLKSQRRVEKMK